MTKQEYIVKQQAVTRGVNKRLVCWLVAFLGALGTMIPFSKYIERHGGKAWVSNLVGVGLLIFLLGSLLWFALFVKRQQRQFGMQCRKCGKQILNPQIAIATGNCGFFGEKLFD
jgi:hypothetical protein